MYKKKDSDCNARKETESTSLKNIRPAVNTKFKNYDIWGKFNQGRQSDSTKRNRWCHNKLSTYGCAYYNQNDERFDSHLNSSSS